MDQILKIKEKTVLQAAREKLCIISVATIQLIVNFSSETMVVEKKKRNSGGGMVYSKC